MRTIKECIRTSNKSKNNIKKLQLKSYGILSVYMLD